MVIISLTCKTRARNPKIVNVDTNDQVCTLASKLGITDIKTKFICNGETYSIYGGYTFQQIGITSNNIIFVNNQAMSGNLNEILFI